MPTSAETTLELSLSRSALDRAAGLRKDAGALRRALDDPATRVLDVYGDRVAFDGEPARARLRYRPPGPQDAGALTGEGDTPVPVVLLGTHEGVAHLAALHPSAETSPGAPSDTSSGTRAPQLAGLRRLGLGLDDLDVGVLASALGLAGWHATHRFCPACGAPTRPAQGGWVRRCEREGTEQYPRTDPAVIMAVTDGSDRLLLARGPQWPPGRLSVLAGFVEPGESLEAAVAREVAEEVGLEVDEVTYRGSQPWPFPRSLMVGFTARSRAGRLRLDPEEIAQARWLTRDDVTAELADGSLLVPGRLSIARHLVELWFGGPLPVPAEEG